MDEPTDPPHDPERDPVDEGAPPTQVPRDEPADELADEPTAPSRASQPGYGGDPHSLDVYPALRRGLVAGLQALPRMALVLLPVYLFSQAVSILGAPDLFLGPVTPGRVPELSTSDWLVFAGLMVFQLTFGTWAQGALLFVGEASLDGAPLPGFRAAYGRALDRVPSLVGTSLLLVLCVGLGTLLCIAPGLWAAAALTWGVLRAGVREEGPLTALRHSFVLTRGRIWRVLGAFLAMVLFVLPLAVLVGIGSVMLRMGSNGAPTTAQLAPLVLLQVVSGIVVAPVIACMQLALHERLETLGPKA